MHLNFSSSKLPGRQEGGGESQKWAWLSMDSLAGWECVDITANDGLPSGKAGSNHFGERIFFSNKSSQISRPVEKINKYTA